MRKVLVRDDKCICRTLLLDSTCHVEAYCVVFGLLQSLRPTPKKRPAVTKPRPVQKKGAADAGATPMQKKHDDQHDPRYTPENNNNMSP